LPPLGAAAEEEEEDFLLVVFFLVPVEVFFFDGERGDEGADITEKTRTTNAKNNGQTKRGKEKEEETKKGKKGRGKERRSSRIKKSVIAKRGAQQSPPAPTSRPHTQKSNHLSCLPESLHSPLSGAAASHTGLIIAHPASQTDSPKFRDADSNFPSFPTITFLADNLEAGFA